EDLIDAKEVDVRQYAGLEWSAALTKLETESKRLNAGNPFAASKITRDRLRANAGWWKAAGADRSLMSWILYGARLPMFEEPLPLEFGNHPSCAEHQKFVDQEIAAAVAEGSFVPIREQDVRIVNPISVEPNKSGKLRM